MSTTASDLSTNYFERLPDELLEKVFSFLCNYLSLTEENHARGDSNLYYFDYSLQQPLLKQNHKELLRASLVCRRFYNIIKSSDFWGRKCHREYIVLPDQKFPQKFDAYEKIYVNNPFHPAYNLLLADKWTKSSQSMSRIERIPHGSYRLFDQFHRLSPCRTTSYQLAKFFQRDVQLPCRGMEFNEIVALRPVIEFSICIAARWDCGARCIITLHFSDEHEWKCERTFPQWNDKKWHRLTYRYAQYQEFPKSVTVSLAGSDTQFWAGFYGIKFSQERLHLIFRENENESNEESEVVIEPNEVDELIPLPELDDLRDDLPNDDASSSTEYGYHYNSNQYEYDSDS